MKYIIKNCPAYCDNTRLCRGAYNREIEYQYCSGNSEENCLLKRIVDECKGVQKTQWVGNKKKPYSPSKALFARNLLKHLEIEEME